MTFQEGNKFGPFKKGNIPWLKGKTKTNGEFPEQIGFRKKNKVGHRFRKGDKQANTGRTWFKKGHEPWYLSGSENPAWLGGISFEPYSVDWTETLKRAIRERDKYRCQECSEYGEDVHHIDYDKKNNDLENLITLCKKCHGKTNHNRKYWTEHFRNHQKI